MDRLEATRIFVAIADAGSLSGAARRLELPLATVSRRLAALEAHLGARLLTRTTRRLMLTEAGRRYLDAGRRILADLDAAERAVGGMAEVPRGRLGLTAPYVFGRMHVLPIVNAFLSAWPEVDVRLLLVDRVVDLIDEGLDLAVRIGPLAESTMVAARVGTIGRYVCGGADYLARHGAPQSPGDLAGHACIAFSAASAVETWSFPVDGRTVAVPIRTRLVVSTAEAAVEAAAAGLGITRVLSYQAAPALEAGRLRRLLVPFEPPPAPVSLVHPEGRLLPAKVRAFRDFAAPRLRRALAPALVSGRASG
ncbi:LysR substrate-binding domain-containing protein [Stella sp.]|uniref:LysR substrate-binding domain-containing protein n=1 Tax=Stella sp. TaxID=2912054 RepID=UPI0035B2001B